MVSQKQPTIIPALAELIRTSHRDDVVKLLYKTYDLGFLRRSFITDFEFVAAVFKCDNLREF
jgi:hypothetical protein